MKKIKFFCLPYAGGTAMVYAKWKKYLNPSIELVPIEMAGRGRLFPVPFYNSVDEAITGIYDSIKNDLEGSEYAIFGHSMGSLLSYELAHRIKELGGRGPVHLFVSGRYPPFVKVKEKIMHLLPDEELKEELLKIGGTPKEVFENKEILDLFIPVIRADYKLVEKYEHIPKKTTLDCDVTALYSDRDEDVNFENMSQWSQCTSKNCRVLEFEGDHFFINNKFIEIADMVNDTLTGERCSRP